MCVCVAFLRRGHAKIVCIIKMLTDDPRRESNQKWVSHTTGCFARDVLQCLSFAQSEQFSNVIPRAPEGGWMSQKNTGVTSRQNY